MSCFNVNSFMFISSAPLSEKHSFKHHSKLSCTKHMVKATNLSNQNQFSRRICLHTFAFSSIALLLRNPSPAIARTHGLPQGAAVETLMGIEYPPSWPYTPSDFRRFDETSDQVFYSSPRLVRHIDQKAISALRQYYTYTLLPNARDVLDICSSVESYLPSSGWATRRRVAGLGMNEVELQNNPTLTEFCIRDLNIDPTLPYDDNQFDLVLCAMSIDYLIHPRKVLQETCRVLRPGGIVAISFSDRVFGTKAISLWMAGADEDHIYTTASFIHFAGGFSQPRVADLSPRKNGLCTGDPLYVVSAVKEG